MVSILKNPDFTPAEFAQFVDMLHRHGGIAYTRLQAAKHVQTATATLEAFDKGPVRDILMDIAEYALVRKT